jgi:hypothetical protein
MRAAKAPVALNNLRHNPHQRWCGHESDWPGPDGDLAANRLANRFLSLSVESKFEVQSGCRIYAMGSCFAREIESALQRTGSNILRYDEQFFDAKTFSSPFPWGRSSFRNRFNTASMLLEIQRITGETDLPSDSLLSGSGTRLPISIFIRTATRAIFR